MATKRTYSVRLEDEQREQLEVRATKIGLPTGHLIRAAIDDFLRQQDEKDYLGEVQAAISTSFTKLARQVEKDSEPARKIGRLQHLREWSYETQIYQVFPRGDGARGAHGRGIGWAA